MTGQLADLMDERRLSLGLTWKDVANRSGLTTETLRQVRAQGSTEIRGLTKRGIETALEWAPGSVDSVLGGGDPVAQQAQSRLDGRLLIGTRAKTITKLDGVTAADMPHPGWVRVVLALDSGERAVSWLRVPAEATVVEFQPGGSE